jgi:hypothetical protein
MPRAMRPHAPTPWPTRPDWRAFREPFTSAGLKVIERTYLMVKKERLTGSYLGGN